MSRTLDGLKQPDSLDAAKAIPSRDEATARLLSEIALLQETLRGAFDGNDFWRRQYFASQLDLRRAQQDNCLQAALIDHQGRQAAEADKREAVLQNTIHKLRADVVTARDKTLVLHDDS